MLLELRISLIEPGLDKSDRARDRINNRRTVFARVSVLVFSRGHATLHLAVSVGR